MRRRAIRMIVVAVTVAVLVVGAPLAVFGGAMIWGDQRATLDLRNSSLSRSVERRIATNEELDDDMLVAWVGGQNNIEANIVVRSPEGEVFNGGPAIEGDVMRSVSRTPSGAEVIMEIPISQVWFRVMQVVGIIAVTSMMALGIAVAIGSRLARRLSAPLIYLAASAEQIGSGQVRPRMQVSGIEEIDLVADELVRTSDRMAGRLAAERQFAADASHQLRTPLAALSMRLEEIEMTSEQEEVRDEARRSLEQVERLTGVVDDLLKTSRSAGGGSTEVVNLDEIFAQQDEEWQQTFLAADRDLSFTDDADMPVLVTPGSLSQVLATLIENSLKYGAGSTTVTTRSASGAKGVFIDVADEGDGVSDELAPEIFTKHVSGKSGTGLGLALARELVTADGGRLELTQRRPPIFRVFVHAVPRELTPEAVLPQGALVSVGRRRGRR
ncbi:ATP-binding protein [Georgenia sp. Z1344]|uniref:ATP-binding protein n=1 Tax=Georgenia sp. Z1344 TaxID=3416706 RepID=UPI003CEF4B07